jgi:hypothetical protein
MGGHERCPGTTNARARAKYEFHDTTVAGRSFVQSFTAALKALRHPKPKFFHGPFGPPFKLLTVGQNVYYLVQGIYLKNAFSG